VRGAAIAVLVVTAALLGACSDDDAARGDDNRLTSAGSLSVFDLEVGDCVLLSDEPADEVDKITATPCSEPHELEVYAIEPYEDGDTYPGPDVLTTFAETTCATEFADYVGVDYLDSELYFTYLLPTLRSWDEGDDRNVVCFATTTGEQITGSVRDSGR
jgi:hypothetical protein